jgi:SNF2 family DNA or RNA helicase
MSTQYNQPTTSPPTISLSIPTQMALIPPRADIYLLPHQEEGIEWMIEREKLERGGILGDDMGLGKTFQTIGLLKNGEKRRTLILAPPALKSGWKEELEKCGYEVREQQQGTNSWFPSTHPEKESVWLTTYPRASLRVESLKRDAFERVILDEGHCIRNGIKTNRFNDCLTISKSTVYRWILSATPIQNGMKDWENLCKWLGVDPAEDGIMLRRTMGELRLTDGPLTSLLPPLPKIIEHELHIKEGTKEGKLFRALCDNAESLMERTHISGLLKLTAYMRIQQFLVHPQIYINAMRRSRKGYIRPDWRPIDTTTKWTQCLSLLKKGVEEKKGIIVFCMFKEEMEMFEEAGKSLTPNVFSIRGGMGQEKLAKELKSSREMREEEQIIVIQIVAGGVGLNLQYCDMIIFSSQHWNPAVVHQAIGRAVRIGQKKEVEVHRIRIMDSVSENLDRKISEKHNMKIEVAREINESLYEGFPEYEEDLKDEGEL